MIDPNQPAYPTMEHGFDIVGCPAIRTEPGLTIRAELAARFVAAMLTHEKMPLPDKAAELALFYADILIEKYNEQ